MHYDLAALKAISDEDALALANVDALPNLSDFREPRCGICNHPVRKLIEYLWFTRDARTVDLAARFNLSNSTIHVHWIHTGLKARREGAAVEALRKIIDAGMQKLADGEMKVSADSLIRALEIDLKVQGKIKAENNSQSFAAVLLKLTPAERSAIEADAHATTTGQDEPRSPDM